MLLKIDPEDYELQISRLEQELEKAQVELERLGVDRDGAGRLLKIHREVADLKKRAVGRLEKLKNSNAITDAEADAVQLAMLTAQQQVTAQENLIRGFDSEQKTLEKSQELATLQLKKAKLDPQRTEIIAPFTSVVIENHVEQNSNVVRGGSVATIEDTSSVEVRCNLRSEDMQFVTAKQGKLRSGNRQNSQRKRPVKKPERQGTLANSTTNDEGHAYQLPPVTATIEHQRGGQVYRWKGVLSRQDGLGVDQATRTVPVRLRVPKPAQSTKEDSIALVRGMFVKVHLHCQPSTPIAVVPEKRFKTWKVRVADALRETANAGDQHRGHQRRQGVR